MPTLNFRMTQEQHAALTAAAAAAGRSLQKELEHRVFGASVLFPEPVVTEHDGVRWSTHMVGPEMESPATISEDPAEPVDAPVARKPRKGRCEHGTPEGVYCKRCGA